MKRAYLAPIGRSSSVFTRVSRCFTKFASCFLLTTITTIRQRHHLKMSKVSNSTPLVASAYAVLPKEDTDTNVSATATATAVELNRPAFRSVNPRYAHIPEARSLFWADDFFDNVGDDEDIVAVFDFDYENMESYYTSLGWTCLGVTLFMPNIFSLAIMGLVPCCLNNNVRWNVQAQHVAITRDGVRFVHDKHSTCWGFPFSDAGKSSKTVPFDMITDCDIVEPAGNTCICTPQTLYSVHLKTANFLDRNRNELNIQGLKDPHSFKKLVWAMKRATTGGATSSLPEALTMVDRGSNNNTDEVATLLREIRDELRQQKEERVTAADVLAPSAPKESEIV